MTLIKKTLSLIFATFAIFTLILGFAGTTNAYAQIKLPDSDALCGTGGCPLISKPSEVAGTGNIKEGVSSLIIEVAKVMTYIAVAVAIVFMVYGGYMWMNVNDPKGAETGQKIVTNSAIGLAIAILAYTIVGLLSSFLSRDLGITNGGGTGGGTAPATDGPPASQ